MGQPADRSLNFNAFYGPPIGPGRWEPGMFAVGVGRAAGCYIVDSVTQRLDPSGLTTVVDLTPLHGHLGGMVRLADTGGVLS